MEVVRGDLLASDCTVLVQQLNCLTTRAHGLSRDIANRFPYADVYARRTPMRAGVNLAKAGERPRPGGLEVALPSKGDTRPIVVGILGQWSCSTPGRYYANVRVPDASGPETHVMRACWFRQGLEALLLWLQARPEPELSVGFPYRIGCGKAGGNWTEYEAMLQRFATRAAALAPAKEIRVRLYCRPEDEDGDDLV